MTRFGLKTLNNSRVFIQDLSVGGVSLAYYTPYPEISRRLYVEFFRLYKHNFLMHGILTLIHFEEWLTTRGVEVNLRLREGLPWPLKGLVWIHFMLARLHFNTIGVEIFNRLRKKERRETMQLTPLLSQTVLWSLVALIILAITWPAVKRLLSK